ncbi:MAG: hypothetical protein KGJ97_04455 [Xanthomonadaceae bacterium]|nr:hypothetical protein [Xanthomonadaceae bacterium]MDE3073620.1 hypothetical protein [Pseudomonadota bacterium]
MNISRKSLVSLIGSLALVMAVGSAAAVQDGKPVNSTNGMGAMGAMHPGHHGMMHAKNMRGMHMMPATVTEVNKKTGMVSVNAEGMALKVHFPPASVADLKQGDKITLHLAYSKP